MHKWQSGGKTSYSINSIFGQLGLVDRLCTSLNVMKTRENSARMNEAFSRVWIFSNEKKNPKQSSVLLLPLLISRLKELTKKNPKNLSNDLD